MHMLESPSLDHERMHYDKDSVLEQDTQSGGGWFRYIKRAEDSVAR